jgi:adenylate cyclase
MQRRLAAIVAADIVGYSRLAQIDETGTVTALRHNRTAIIEPKAIEHDGRVVKFMGDGLLAEFGSVVNAVRFACDMLKAIVKSGAEMPPDRRLHYRVGINMGDVIVEENDIFGEGVNIAARLEGLADPDSICLSGLVYEQVKNKLDLPFEPLGRKTLKNIAEPVPVYRIAFGERAHALEPVSLDLPERPSIAVLPFDNLTGDPEQQYFSDGITEDIITELSRFRALFIIARTSSFAYRGASADVAAIGRELGVRYILTGSVRRADGRLRITAQLYEAETGRSIWAFKQDRDASQLFAMDDEIVRSIVAALPGRIEADWLARAKRKRTGNMVAYDYMLRAWDSLYRHGGTEHRKIAELLNRALELDPAYAQAYALLAFVTVLGWYRGEVPDPLETAYDLATQGVSLDCEDGWCHFALGFVCLYRHDYEEAALHYERAVDLNPNDAELLSQMGAFLTYVGRAEEGIEWIRRAMRLNPYRPSWHWHDLGFALLCARRYAEAIKAFQHVVPPLPFDNCYIAVCYAHLGDLERARIHGRAMLESQPGTSIIGWMPREPFRNPADMEHLVAGMRMAGLPEQPSQQPRLSVVTATG